MYLAAVEPTIPASELLHPRPLRPCCHWNPSSFILRCANKKPTKCAGRLGAHGICPNCIHLVVLWQEIKMRTWGEYYRRTHQNGYWNKNVSMWTGMIWFGIRTREGMLWTLLRICRFHTIREMNCWVTNRLSIRTQFILIFIVSNVRILVRLQWVHKMIFYNVMVSGSYGNHCTFFRQLRRSIFTLSYRPFTFPGLTKLFIIHN
jgi:hypothetical protein